VAAAALKKAHSYIEQSQVRRGCWLIMYLCEIGWVCLSFYAYVVLMDVAAAELKNAHSYIEQSHVCYCCYSMVCIC
jgi:hypothetical protein